MAQAKIQPSDSSTCDFDLRFKNDEANYSAEERGEAERRINEIKEENKEKTLYSHWNLLLQCYVCSSKW